MAERLFNLIPSDIGRPLSQISPAVEAPDLPSIITQSIDTVSPIERTVKDSSGRSYIMRIRPFKSADNRIDGAVIALLDVEPAET